MIIWKSLLSKCLQYVKNSTNEVYINAIAVVRTNSHCKKEVVGHVRQKSG